MRTWPRSLELQLLRREDEGLVLGTVPLCLQPCGSGTVHLGNLHSSLEPIQSPNLLLKMEAKLFLGPYSNIIKPSDPAVQCPWWFL